MSTTYLEVIESIRRASTMRDVPSDTFLRPRAKEGFPLSAPIPAAEGDVIYWTNMALAKHIPGKDSQRLMGEALASTPQESIPDEWFAKAGREWFATMQQVVKGVGR